MSPSAPPNPFQFSSKYTDGEGGLVYYGQRYYDPSIGRWLSKDPMEERGGSNLYVFVQNDAQDMIDAHGLKILANIRDLGQRTPETDNEFPGAYITGHTDVLSLQPTLVIDKSSDGCCFTLNNVSASPTIAYWWSSTASRVHELHHVADDVRIIQQLDSRLSPNSVNAKSKDCVVEIVRLNFQYTVKMLELATYLWDAQDYPGNLRAARSAQAAQAKLEVNALEKQISDKLIDCKCANKP